MRGQAAGVHASIIWTSQHPANPTVVAHCQAGGRAVITADGWVTEIWGDESQPILHLAEAPITFGGQARHMVENVLNATGAALAMEVGRDHIAAGLRSFGTNPDDNVGRLHVYDLHGATVVLDYAHNEAGLTHLLSLARSYLAPDGRLTTIIGTAGDRTDAALREIGRLAAVASDRVVVKETHRYLRGRANVDEMTALYVGGIEAGGDTAHVVASDELDALDKALAGIRPGDAVAMMCIETGPESRAHVEALGGTVRGPRPDR